MKKCPVSYIGHFFIQILISLAYLYIIKQTNIFTMTKTNFRDALKALISTNEFDTDIEHLYMLKNRWSSEREYENFADYIKNAKVNIESFEVTDMSKKFVIFARLNNTDFKIQLLANKWRIQM